MGHGYIVIRVVYWVELPEQRGFCPIFVKKWIPINGTQQCGISYSKSTGIPQDDGLSTGPPSFEASH